MFKTVRLVFVSASAVTERPELQLHSSLSNLDPSTGRMVVVAAGIANFGTLAAGEFINRPAYQDLATHAPRGWDRKNLQIILTAKLIETYGSPGPPACWLPTSGEAW